MGASFDFDITSPGVLLVLVALVVSVVVIATRKSPAPKPAAPIELKTRSADSGASRAALKTDPVPAQPPADREAQAASSQAAVGVGARYAQEHRNVGTAAGGAESPARGFRRTKKLD